MRSRCCGRACVRASTRDHHGARMDPLISSHTRLMLNDRRAKEVGYTAEACGFDSDPGAFGERAITTGKSSLGFACYRCHQYLRPVGHPNPDWHRRPPPSQPAPGGRPPARRRPQPHSVLLASERPAAGRAVPGGGWSGRRHGAEQSSRGKPRL